MDVMNFQSVMVVKEEVVVVEVEVVVFIGETGDIGKDMV